jgi:glutathione synthase/RimK-type ligase-like ATP-grasp enzyme
MQARNWDEAVLKPAVGSRGRGVVRVALSSWGLAHTTGAMRLLLQGDVLLQPFLPPVRVRVLPPGPATASIYTKVWGEICVIFLEGRVVHAVHKVRSN